MALTEEFFTQYLINNSLSLFKASFADMRILLSIKYWINDIKLQVSSSNEPVSS